MREPTAHLSHKGPKKKLIIYELIHILFGLIVKFWNTIDMVCIRRVIYDTMFWTDILSDEERLHL